ncbi:hypothetical protein FB451DRAFT_1252202 [Mycena latifolia]|nr:hypothetical protein FB451DRAFT_1252202 [Mycena latifolia]
MPGTISLTQLNSLLFVSNETPCDSALDVIESQPSVILFFGNTTIQEAFQQKYLVNIHARFPRAILVVIKSHTSFFWNSTEYLESLLMPLADLLRSKTSQQLSSGILVYILSNGGGFTYVILHKLLERMKMPAPLMARGTPSALILDSTPGDNGMESAISLALAIAIRAGWPGNALLYAVVAPPVALLYCIFRAINAIRGNPPIFQEFRETLFSPDLLPSLLDSGGEPAATPRMYIYSTIDWVAKPQDIISHLEESRRKGFRTKVEVYDSTNHIRHAVKYPERYWAAVTEFWNESAPRI